MIIGSATNDRTCDYLKKYDLPLKKTPWFYTSPIGIGTHLGEMNETDSELYRESIEYCFKNGINFVDTALNYRGMRSERDIGFVLKKLIQNLECIKREEIVVSTKGGLIPGDIQAKLVPKDYLKQVLLKNKIISESDLNIVGHNRHVLAPSYFQFAIEESRKHLNLGTIDIYYLHNPELSLMVLGEEKFYRQLELLFRFFEGQVEEGKIKFYGMATWLAFLHDPSYSEYISLEKVIKVAKMVAGENHHCRFIQLPMNNSMLEGRMKKNQKVNQKWLSTIDAALELNIMVTTSAPYNLGFLL